MEKAFRGRSFCAWSRITTTSTDRRIKYIGLLWVWLRDETKRCLLRGYRPLLARFSFKCKTMASILQSNRNKSFHSTLILLSQFSFGWNRKQLEHFEIQHDRETLLISHAQNPQEIFIWRPFPLLLIEKVIFSIQEGTIEYMHDNGQRNTYQSSQIPCTISNQTHMPIWPLSVIGIWRYIWHAVTAER